MPCLQHRNTDCVRLTSCTRCHASSVVSSTEPSSSGEMPALLNSTSMRPYSLARLRVHVAHRVLVGDVGREREVAPAMSSRRSTPTTSAPSARNSRAVSAPMPLAAPVITHTLPSSRPLTSVA